MKKENKDAVGFLKKYKKNLFIIYVILVVVCLAILIPSLYFTVKPKTKNDIGTTTNTKFDYKVIINDNDFYEDNELSPNMTYIASLIKYIDVNLKYNAQSNEKLDYNFNYRIDAITRVYNDGSKQNIIFEKTEPILDTTNETLNDSSSYYLNKNIRLDYNKYNNLISTFKTAYLLSSESDLTLRLHVDAEVVSKSDLKRTTFSEDSLLVIPLTKQTVNISLTENTGNIYNIRFTNTTGIIQDKKFFIISLTDSLILMLLVIIKIGYSFKASDKFKYDILLNKILKEYDLIIINSNNAFDESNYNIVEVSSFMELKDVYDNVGKPIIFKEITKGKKSTFVIAQDNILYKYILDSKKV